ncbi:hypothetical protein T09_9799 [Trichinella sp. T9]|nr:hypothetical protein T09_9799 [Trichinella sp. T9]
MKKNLLDKTVVISADSLRLAAGLTILKFPKWRLISSAKCHCSTPCQSLHKKKLRSANLRQRIAIDKLKKPS